MEIHKRRRKAYTLKPPQVSWCDLLKLHSSVCPHGNKKKTPVAAMVWVKTRLLLNFNDRKFWHRGNQWYGIGLHCISLPILWTQALILIYWLVMHWTIDSRCPAGQNCPKFVFPWRLPATAEDSCLSAERSIGRRCWVGFKLCRNILANEKWRYICNVFLSHWLWPCHASISSPNHVEIFGDISVRIWSINYLGIEMLLCPRQQCSICRGMGTD